jgi:hypothetical protein
LGHAPANVVMAAELKLRKRNCSQREYLRKHQRQRASVEGTRLRALLPKALYVSRIVAAVRTAGPVGHFRRTRPLLSLPPLGKFQRSQRGLSAFDPALLTASISSEVSATQEAPHRRNLQLQRRSGACNAHMNDELERQLSIMGLCRRRSLQEQRVN